MIDWHKTSDGVLFAPLRGRAPACPRGFEPVPGDDFRFHPEIRCQHREQRQLKLGCCNNCVAYYCHRDNSYKLQSICKVCHDRENN